MQPSTDVMIFTGPSGGGKSTMIRHLLRQWPQHFGFCTSHTTRKPRSGEVDGKHYHFVSRETFQQMISDDMFVEYNRVFSSEQKPGVGSCNLSGCNTQSTVEDVDYYGTTRKELHGVMSQGKIALMDTDIAGAINIKKYCEGLTGNVQKQQQQQQHEKFLRVRIVLVKTTSLEVLKDRLIMRGSESDASLRSRLAESEMCLKWFAAHPDFVQYVLENNSLDAALAELRSFVTANVLSAVCKL